MRDRHLEKQIAALRAVKAQPGKNIYVVGGPTFVTSLLNAGLLDELINRRIALDDINDGFAEMAKGDVEVDRAELVRAVIVMDGTPSRG